ncbi:hypothetical protein NIASO_13575 [Niabella soli DSM 19437]|uniref:Uncharacterized protein n=1 Tax=Niabella soli DSM 19437 TaxID=929713 RepID=W0F8G7_9BACT|nr:hypothetical protein NIASO_13575 [Niabella soli DSM 19437]
MTILPIELTPKHEIINIPAADTIHFYIGKRANKKI